MMVHWLAVFVGVRNASWATWWGGFGSDLPELAIFLVLYRKFVCHADTCRRLGLHRVEGTPFTTCKKHHPHGGNTAEAIMEAHHRAVSSQKLLLTKENDAIQDKAVADSVSKSSS